MHFWWCHLPSADSTVHGQEYRKAEVRSNILPKPWSCQKSIGWCRLSFCDIRQTFDSSRAYVKMTDQTFTLLLTYKQGHLRPGITEKECTLLSAHEHILPILKQYKAGWKSANISFNHAIQGLIRCQVTQLFVNKLVVQRSMSSSQRPLQFAVTDLRQPWNTFFYLCTEHLLHIHNFCKELLKMCSILVQWWTLTRLNDWLCSQVHAIFNEEEVYMFCLPSMKEGSSSRFTLSPKYP